MVKLAFTAVFIINQVKLRRLILGIAARDLSRLLNMSDSYVSTIESGVNKAQYTTNELVKIAKILGCTVQDFYPPDEVLLKQDSELVFKKIINLSNENDTIAIIRGMINNNHFKENTSLADIEKHLHLLAKVEKETVAKALNILAKNKEIEFNNGFYTTK